MNTMRFDAEDGKLLVSVDLRRIGGCGLWCVAFGLVQSQGVGRGVGMLCCSLGGQ